MHRQAAMSNASLGSTEMEEILASVNFVDNFTNKFDGTSLCYNFSITDLRTKISELSSNEDNLLIFYLHHSKEDFSWNFCNFLQDPIIEVAFSKDKFILYCWDIETDDLKPKLIQGCRNEIGDACAYYIEQNKSIVFIIKLENGVPVIIDIYEDAADLIRLYNLLTGESPVENVVEEVITPLSFQKLMETYLGDRDYNSYERKEHELLKKNIGYALYGPPEEVAPERDGVTIAKYTEDQQKEINALFLQILKQNDSFCKWNGRIIISFIYVCAEALPEDKLKRAQNCKKKNEKYNPDADFIPYPVFILRRCKHDDPVKACRIVIDHEGRVYKSWKCYLEDNRLPPCKMLYPEDGRYHSEKDVVFSTSLSPACNITKKAANVSDVAAGVTGLVAGGVTAVGSIPAVLSAAPLIAAAAPIALPVAATLGIGAGLYAAGRSIYSLVDRSKHKQNINLSNSESRAAYLNLAGAALSAGMFGAARTVSFLAGRGVQLGQGTRYVLYGINGVSLTVNGIGIGNNVYEAIRARQASPLFVAQTCASILFFGNALYNFKAIANIIEESQTRALSEIETSLRSNRHRRTFNKLLKESIRTQGETRGKASVIATMRNMENVDDVMATLTRSNRMLNKEGIRFSAEDGNIHLNGVSVKMTNFGSMNTAAQLSFLENFPPIPENLTPNVQYTITQDVRVWFDGIGILSRLCTNLTVDQLVKEILSAFQPFVRDYIMDISKRFFIRLDPAIANRFATMVTEAVVKLMKWIVNKLMDMDIFKKILNHKAVSSEEIDCVVGELEEDFLCHYVNYELDSATKEKNKEERKIGNKRKDQEDCKICGGYYYV